MNKMGANFNIDSNHDLRKSKINKEKAKLKSTKFNIFLFALKEYLLKQGFCFLYQYAIDLSTQYP